MALFRETAVPVPIYIGTNNEATISARRPITVFINTTIMAIQTMTKANINGDAMWPRKDDPRKTAVTINQIVQLLRNVVRI